MSDLDRVVPVTITRQSQFPSLPAFNTVLLAAEFLASAATPVFGTTERVRALTGGSTAILAALTTMFGASSVFVSMATAMFLQNPSINSLYIGRKLTGGDGSETWGTALTAMALANSGWYGILTPDRLLASQQAIATWTEANNKIYFADSADPNIPGGTGDIAAYLKAGLLTRSMAFYSANSIGWNDEIVFTMSGAWVTGNKCTLTINGSALGEITFATTSLAMMQALKAEIDIAYPSATCTIDGTAHTITLKQIGMQFNGANSLAISGGTPPTYLTTYPDNTAVEKWPAACLMSYGFALSSSGANIPGSVDYAYLVLAGVLVDTLTPTQITTITGKYGNFYSSIAGVNVFQFGTVGNGEHIDVIIGLDYIKSVIQTQIFTFLSSRANQPKVPYTDVGIQQVVSQLRAALQVGVDGGIIINPVITYPAVSAVSSAQKATRQLTNVNFTASLVGAIETSSIAGIVTY